MKIELLVARLNRIQEKELKSNQREAQATQKNTYSSRCLLSFFFSSETSKGDNDVDY